MADLIRRSLFVIVVVFYSSTVLAHHWYQETYDSETLVTVEIEVTEFRFINPHPFFSGKLVDSLGARLPNADSEDSIWEMQMDNRWELQELGFTRETLLAGDKLVVTAHPGMFKKNTLYVKAIEHLRLEFRYEHNVRQLLDLPSP